ncbi:MAG: hypothetical protein ACREJR_08225 [Candidatus Rokuibacteriota bacterium]
MRLTVVRALALVTLSLAVTPAWAHGPATPAPRIDRLEAALAPVVSVPRAEVIPGAPRSDSAAVRPPTVTATLGAVDVIAVLLVALGLGGLARAWRRDRRSALAAGAAGLLLGFVVETTPHLVHHSLDADQGASCEVLQTAERAQAAIGALDAAPVSTPSYLDDRLRAAPAPTLSVLAPCGRAPPA